MWAEIILQIQNVSNLAKPYLLGICIVSLYKRMAISNIIIIFVKKGICYFTEIFLANLI